MEIKEFCNNYGFSIVLIDNIWYVDNITEKFIRLLYEDSSVDKSYFIYTMTVNNVNIDEAISIITNETNNILLNILKKYLTVFS